MQFELQPVEKVSFSKFAWAFAPKMLEIGLPRLGMNWRFLPWIYPELFSASPGAQLQEITVSTLSIRSGVSTFSIQLGNNPRLDRKNVFSIRSEILIVFDTQLDRNSADRDFLQLGPWRSGKQLWTDYGETSKSFWREEDQFPAFFGAKAHAATIRYRPVHQKPNG